MISSLKLLQVPKNNCDERKKTSDKSRDKQHREDYLSNKTNLLKGKGHFI